MILVRRRGPATGREGGLSMLHRIGLVAAAFAALVALAANASQWQPYGLTDRPAPAIAALPGTSGPMFVFNAGAAYAAYSPDAGATWRHRTLDTILSPPTEFPATFIAGIPTQVFLNRFQVPWWSPDETRTWVPIAFPTPTPADDGNGYAIGGINPSNTQEIVTFFGGRVARTTDGGASWSFELAPFHASRITVDWVARRIYAWRFDGFAGKALDSAGPWLTQAPTPYYDALGGVVVATQGASLTRSADGGASFQPVGANLGPVNVCAIAFAPSAPGTVYAVDCVAAKSRQILRSVDAGATWTRAGFVPEELGGLGDSGTVALTVDGARPLRVWVGTAWGLHESVDGGVTVQRVPRASGSPGLARRVLFDATAPQRQWLSGRVIRTQDGGATWEQIDPGTFPYSVEWASRVRTNVVLGGERDLTFSRTALSTDGGATWTPKIVVSGRFGSAPRAIVDGQLGEVYVLQRVDDVTGERVFVSFDDGDSFAQRAQIPALPLSASASRTSTTVLYIGVDAGANAIGLVRSTDQGTTLAAVATLPQGGAVNAVAVAPSSATTIYVGYRTPSPYAILRSVDGGVTWQPASSGLGAGAVTSIAVDPAVATTAYAVVQGSGAFRTTDGGATWHALDEGLLGAAREATSITIDPRDAQRLYLSTNAGQFVLDLAAGLPLGDRRAIEYYHAAFNHYFVSADLDEIAGLDAGVFQGWARTGESFRVAEGDDSGNLPVCRFFGVGFAPLSSHFYTPYPAECDIVKADPKWFYEKIAFGLALPESASHGCPPETRPLYRLWNANRDGAPNHRYTTSMATFEFMRNQEWIFEGEKETRVFACVPD
jgi:photosystem II stability/assembly factor-like uncharacterized protein